MMFPTKIFVDAMEKETNSSSKKITTQKIRHILKLNLKEFIKSINIILHSKFKVGHNKIFNLLSESVLFIQNILVSKSNYYMFKCDNLLIYCTFTNDGFVNLLKQC